MTVDAGDLGTVDPIASILQVAGDISRANSIYELLPHAILGANWRLQCHIDILCLQVPLAGVSCIAEAPGSPWL